MESNTKLVKFCTNSTFWGRFSGNKSYMLLNNISEAFNNVIVDGRAKPIYIILEDIRLYLLNRRATNREK